MTNLIDQQYICEALEDKMQSKEKYVIAFKVILLQNLLITPVSQRDLGVRQPENNTNIAYCIVQYMQTGDNRNVTMYFNKRMSFVSCKIFTYQVERKFSKRVLVFKTKVNGFLCTYEKL